MTKETAITVRLSEQLKRRLARRARLEHRSISGQVVYELERALAAEDAPGAAPVCAVGLYADARLPSDDEIAEVRGALWGRVGS